MFVARINDLLAEKSRVERHRVTQTHLAEYLGISRQAVSAMAHPRGIKTLHAETVAQLCDFFELNPVDYFRLFDLVLEPMSSSDEEIEEGQFAGAAAA